MLSETLRKLLDSINDIPSIPTVASEVLRAMEDPMVGAKEIGKIVDKDQALTVRILRMANSPVYGFRKQVSTVDLAVVILGMDNLKEVIMSYIVQGFFSKVQTSVFNTVAFWEYCLLAASAARITARKLKYKLAGEAFIAGLMHDIGIMILAEFFTDSYIEIKKCMAAGTKSIIECEKEVLGASHAEIGGWLANKWGLPDKLCHAIAYHHTHYKKLKPDSPNDMKKSVINVPNPLTAVVSIAEWISMKINADGRFIGNVEPEYYLAQEVFSNLSDHDYLAENSSFNLLITDIKEEYNLVIDELKL